LLDAHQSPDRRFLLLAAPVLFSLAFVLTVYADSGSALESLPRPLAVAALGALLIQAPASLLLWSWNRGAVAAFALLCAIVSPTLAVTLALTGITIVIFARLRRFSAAPFATHLWTVVAFLFGIALIRVVISPGFDLGDLGSYAPRRPATEASSPDVFMFLLDGYPRSDTLAAWGYDNTWFEAELRRRGFTVSAESHSEYTKTDIVLATTFQMRQLDNVPELRHLSTDRVEYRRQIRSALDSAPALDFLRDHGYVTYSAGHPSDYMTLKTDHYFDGGTINDFELQALNRTMLARVALPSVLESRREQVLEALDAAEQVAQDPRTTFLFAHLMNPHPPFIFDRDGDLPPISCSACAFRIHIEESGMTANEFRGALTDQVDYLNHLVLDTLDATLAASPDAIVVVFSDHGSRARQVPNPEWNRSFFAARMTHYPNPFPSDVRPVAIFPRLFSALFGDHIAIPPEL
jgi:hypothetical protein